jgi:hypothetical protein
MLLHFREVFATHGTMSNDRILPGNQTPVPVPVAAAGEQATRRFVEFFTANIRNRNTRQAYARAVADFFRWTDAAGGESLTEEAAVGGPPFGERAGHAGYQRTAGRGRAGR